MRLPSAAGLTRHLAETHRGALVRGSSIPIAAMVTMAAASVRPDENNPDAVDVPREFHRRMATIIDAVQTGVWLAGVHDLLGYATDYAFGDKRGLQTLVLKTSRRSAYVRLQWETIMAESPPDKQAVENAIANAIRELS